MGHSSHLQKVLLNQVPSLFATFKHINRSPTRTAREMHSVPDYKACLLSYRQTIRTDYFDSGRVFVIQKVGRLTSQWEEGREGGGGGVQRGPDASPGPQRPPPHMPLVACRGLTHPRSLFCNLTVAHGSDRPRFLLVPLLLLPPPSRPESANPHFLNLETHSVVFTSFPRTCL